jgi:hypothetical protein
MSPKYAFTPLPPLRGEARGSSLSEVVHSTWRGEYVDQHGTARAFTFLRDQSVDSSVVGRLMFFVTQDVAPTGVRLLDASAQSFVALVGPYYDPRENADVITVFEGTRNGASVVGTFYTRLTGWRENLRQGRFTATCADTSSRAA